ncbi:MAG: molybdenum cofactor biosynthesis protein MoaE [Propioniciclava sp.]
MSQPHTSRVVLAEVSGEPLNPAAILAAVERPDAGAIAHFVGRVRDHDSQAEGTVVALDYTAHPQAGELIGGIVAEAAGQADPDGVCTVAAVHRVGRLAVGDDAFIVAVAAPHRREAFAACELVVEQVKQKLPVWKQQFTADGAYHWSGL